MDEMPTFDELYARLVKAALHDATRQELEQLRKEDLDEHQLDCLLHPQNYPPVWRVGKCDCAEDEQAACAGKCLFHALYRDKSGSVVANKELCVGCEDCAERCRAKHLVASRDAIPVLTALHDEKAPVFAIVAPAFLGQFSPDVTPGKLRAAFKRLGFAGMVEVALFADILTLKEAFEFDETIHSPGDYLLTSCCCPIWIAMIRKVYHQLVPHIPGAVSPMIACGRTIKKLEPSAKVVFIGPCVAKKAEIREPDLVGAVDYVLTFQEVQGIFRFAGIDPAELEEDDRDHSSKAGRIYARTGGVSEAVEATVARLHPGRDISVRARQADGVPACREMLNDLLAGNLDANFLEGMGCVGGCVGGPKAILNREDGKAHVEEYAGDAASQTPLDNPYVLELLHRLGFQTVESFVHDSDLFTRKF